MNEFSRRTLMSIFENGALPLMAAPMFLVTGPELVIAAARAGVVAVYPAPNARDLKALDQVLGKISREAGDLPWGMNMIVHSSYDRFDQELELVLKYQPTFVSTALGSPRRVIEHVHGYGGVVVADVNSIKLARKATEAGVDGLILVTSGAGGHTGTYHPFSFIQEVRKFWDGPIGLAGGISTGADIRAAQVAGADFAVAGTRFIATKESLAASAYKQEVVKADIEDLVLSSAVSGVLANWLKPTLDRAGYTADSLKEETKIDFSGNISTAPKAWKDVWSAGHGVGSVDHIPSVAESVAELRGQYLDCLRREQEQVAALLDRVPEREFEQLTAEVSR